MITCKQCLHHIPDKIGDGTGIAQCAKIEEYKLKMPNDFQLYKAYMKIGNRWGETIIWPGERNCEKFERARNLHSVHESP